VNSFRKGLQDGLPIALGYLSVSFTFGMMAVSGGLTWWEAMFISLTNLTSAGQFAGLDIMIAFGSVFEMAMAELVINLRYALMSISLSQKVDDSITGIYRWILGFGITDEIFGVAASQEESFGRRYFAGLMILPIIGWTTGTVIGAVSGNLLPESICNALGIAIYGMFLAVIIPKARQDKGVLKVIMIAVVLSCCFRYLPALNKVSSGFVIIICAVVASGIGALLFPVKQQEVA
jgi:predicted branched-subunit amino acid permease